jgi:PadR family transcriptional regulator PadR
MANDERDLLRGNTPTLVLAVLRDAPLHGYAIAREINQRSGQALQFKQGTLYPALHALERDGLIAGEWEMNSGERPRKVYAITDKGLAELQRLVQAWSQFSTAVNAIIGEAPHEQPA